MLKNILKYHFCVYLIFPIYALNFMWLVLKNVAFSFRKSNTQVQCCRNCCETNDNENLNDESFKHTHKNKKATQ